MGSIQFADIGRSAAVLAALLSVCLAGCSPSDGDSAGTVPGRWYTAAQVDDGRELFRKQCAGCHGLEAQGTADWRRRDASGRLPPPPLDGSAHAWHHSLEQLRDYVLVGGVPLGGTMPGFGSVLGEDQALAAIAFFQSTWSDDIYARWASLYPAPNDGAD